LGEVEDEDLRAPVVKTRPGISTALRCEKDESDEEGGDKTHLAVARPRRQQVTLHRTEVEAADGTFVEGLVAVDERTVGGEEVGEGKWGRRKEEVSKVRGKGVFDAEKTRASTSEFAHPKDALGREETPV